MAEQENNSMRLGLVIALLIGAVAIVFSPVIQKISHPSEKMSQFVKLNPGIDMVGGTSLVYEIKRPEGVRPNGKLASDVAEALKRRVDPEGVRNLVWRPQGDTRLEIQMPLNPDSKNNSEERAKVRQELIAATDALKATNIQPDQVIDAIEGKNGKTKADLTRLAGDSKARQTLFAHLTDLWSQIQQARANHDLAKLGPALIEYNKIAHPASEAGIAVRSQIEDTNLSIEKLDEALIATDPKEDADTEKQKALDAAARTKAIDAIKAKNADFPTRLAAIDRFVAASQKNAEFKDDLGDATDLKRKLKGAGVLEYHILATDMPPQEYQSYLARLQQDGPRVRAGDEAKWFEVDPNEKKIPNTTYNGKRYTLAYIRPTADGKPRSLDAHADKPWHLADANPSRDQSGGYAVSFRFDPQGAAYFGELTENNINRPMAIVLDNKIISAPNINSKITSSGEITGGNNGFELEEMEYLVSTLKAGSLPAALSEEPISERTVGPQLGADNLRAGLIACGLGLVVVAVFLCSYYFLAGVVATAAVLMNVLLVLAVMSAMGATFTLPSIAGIVLSVGTAVDANVLIFERLREEQHAGLSLRLALRRAYGKAFSAIVDSNMTTAITSVFLIMFGTEEVKGFGVTLIIGIVASLFTALFVTRTIFNVLMEKIHIHTLRSVPLIFPKWDKALRPNIDWMGKAWMFIAFSIIGIVVGMTLFVIKVRDGQMMGIEFASGTSVTVELNKSMKTGELRSIMEANIKANKKEAALPAFAVVTVGNEGTTFEIVTPNSDAVQVRDAILKVLVDDKGQPLLKVDVPSKFDGAGQKAADVVDKLVFPLDEKSTAAASQWPGGYRPDDYQDFAPGVAVALSHLDPPLTPAQVADRIRQAQLQLPGDHPAARLEIAVKSASHNASTPSSQIVVLCRNDLLPYAKDKAKWEESLAAPLWDLANDAVNRPVQLQQIKNFDPQVARDATRDAIMALVFSIVVIMAYIWFRFGNLKYGTATMAALVHDVLFTVAALGYAHYLYNVPGIGNLLQLEPFRIDLTVVAGILTIMGYSMIDTIVVFDRIRENRGKFGAVNRKVINDAINQTLSRTLLTAGTNVVTVAIMYFLGGPGIHGFTFVLLFGILVGTYSSVAIAAPILLLGRQEQEAGQYRGRARLARA